MEFLVPPRPNNNSCIITLPAQNRNFILIAQGAVLWVLEKGKLTTVFNSKDYIVSIKKLSNENILILHNGIAETIKFDLHCNPMLFPTTFDSFFWVTASDTLIYSQFTVSSIDNIAKVKCSSSILIMDYYENFAICAEENGKCSAYRFENGRINEQKIFNRTKLVDLQVNVTESEIILVISDSEGFQYALKSGKEELCFILLWSFCYGKFSSVSFFDTHKFKDLILQEYNDLLSSFDYHLFCLRGQTLICFGIKSTFENMVTRNSGEVEFVIHTPHCLSSISRILYFSEDGFLRLLIFGHEQPAIYSVCPFSGEENTNVASIFSSALESLNDIGTGEHIIPGQDNAYATLYSDCTAYPLSSKSEVKKKTFTEISELDPRLDISDYEEIDGHYFSLLYKENGVDTLGIFTSKSGKPTLLVSKVLDILSDRLLDAFTVISGCPHVALISPLDPFKVYDNCKLPIGVAKVFTCGANSRFICIAEKRKLQFYVRAFLNEKMSWARCQTFEFEHFDIEDFTYFNRQLILKGEFVIIKVPLELKEPADSEEINKIYNILGLFSMCFVQSARALICNGVHKVSLSFKL